MFKKKKCKNCKEKLGDNFNFCPYCRMPLETNGKEWGMLGKNDFVGQEEIRIPLSLDKIMGSAFKMLNKQVKELNQNQFENIKTTPIKGGIKISISTSKNEQPKIEVKKDGGMVEKAKLPRGLSAPNSKKFAGLPKKEPATDIRRLSNKVIYEIKMPGVTSIKDVSIVQLENSIEIKALAKDKVFQKIIPINLPIKDYALSKGKLVLELDAKE